MPEDPIKPSGPSYGLPEGVSPEAVTARKHALIQNGTEPLLAQQLAIEAESNQVATDTRIAAQPEPKKKGAK